MAAGDENDRAAKRRHYEKNREHYYANNMAKRRVLGEIIREAKRRPCMDCGVEYPFYVMDFDHREGEVKTMSIGSRGPASGSVEKLRLEISKCDVVCANCHRERTWQRAAVGQQVVRQPSKLE